MLIAYTIIIIIAIIFKMSHFPGGNILLVYSPFLILANIIRISIVKNDKKFVYVLSSIAMLFVSFFITFKFLSWPGATFIGTFGISFLLVVILLAVRYKLIKRFRFLLLSTLLIFASFNYVLKNSTFKMFYITEDPFSENPRIQHWKIQAIAFDFYNEGALDKAKTLTQKNIKHLNELIGQNSDHDFIMDIHQRNLQIAKSDLKKIEVAALLIAPYLVNQS